MTSVKLKESSDTLDHVLNKPFSLSDDMKLSCLEALYCGEKKLFKPPENRIYKTWTSHWVKNKRISRHVYSLFKVKRWHLMDENFLFDPLKKCQKQAKLTPTNTLWQTFNPKEDKDCYESRMSVDSLLSHALKKASVRESFQNLEMMLECLDDARDTDNLFDAEDLFEELNTNYKNYAHGSKFSYQADRLIQHLSHALFRKVSGHMVRERAFEDTFKMLVYCIAACIGEEMQRYVDCEKSVDGFVLEKVLLPIKMMHGEKKEEQQKHSLEIRSKPDLFLYHRRGLYVAEPRTVLAVVEVKGMRKGVVVHSDGEEDRKSSAPDETESESLPRRTSQRQSDLGSLEEEDEDEENDDYDDDEDSDGEHDESNVEKPATEAPKWLQSIKKLPDDARKACQKFLPQLLGEMWCGARSKNMEPIKAKNGLLFGIGVVGFEIYFVSMLDSCRNAPESVVNTDAAFTNVFVTRPLNLFVRKDRRIILKTIAASFSLHKPSLDSLM